MGAVTDSQSLSFTELIINKLEEFRRIYHSSMSQTPKEYHYKIRREINETIYYMVIYYSRRFSTVGEEYFYIIRDMTLPTGNWQYRTTVRTTTDTEFLLWDQINLQNIDKNFPLLYIHIEDCSEELYRHLYIQEIMSKLKNIAHLYEFFYMIDSDSIREKKRVYFTNLVKLLEGALYLRNESIKILKNIISDLNIYHLLYPSYNDLDYVEGFEDERFLQKIKFLTEDNAEPSNCLEEIRNNRITRLLNNFAQVQSAYDNSPKTPQVRMAFNRIYILGLTQLRGRYMTNFLFGKYKFRWIVKETKGYQDSEAFLKASQVKLEDIKMWDSSIPECDNDEFHTHLKAKIVSLLHSILEWYRLFSEVLDEIQMDIIRSSYHILSNLCRPLVNIDKYFQKEKRTCLKNIEGLYLNHIEYQHYTHAESVHISHESFIKEIEEYIGELENEL